MDAQNNENKWLVKANSSVTGPFRFDSVVEAIFKGDIHVLDEIKGPFERWRPIRDHSLFNAAIEKLKATTYSRRENTLTDNVDYGTQDITQTIGTEIDEQTQTETLNVFSDDNTNASPAEVTPTDAMGGEPTMRVPEAILPNSGPEQGPKVYPHPPMAAPKFPFATFAGIVVLCCGVLGYFYFQMRSSKSQGAELANPAYDFTDRGELALKQGDYASALGNFQKASQLLPTDPEIALVLAPLEIHFGAEVKRSMDTVEQILAGNLQANAVKGRNVIGIGHAKLGNHRAAIQQYDVSLQKDESYFPAWVNKGYSLIALKRPQDAISVLNEAIQLSAKDGYFARYLLIQAHVAEGNRRQQQAPFEEAIEHANYFISRLKAFDFLQEVMFFKAIALKNTGVPKPELTAFVRKMLSIDPLLTELHSHDIHWNFQSFDWRLFADDCGALANALNGSDGEILLGYCALKRGETLTAKNKFERQLRKKPQDGVLRGLITATLSAREEQEASEALVFHDRINERNLFADIVMRECLSKRDIDCADKVEVMLENQVNILYRNWYQAEKFKESQKSLAMKALGNGLDVSYRFIPFLRLKRDL